MYFFYDLRVSRVLFVTLNTPPTAQKYNQPTKQVKQKRQTATGIGAWSFLVPLNSSRIASEKRQLRS